MPYRPVSSIWKTSYTALHKSFEPWWEELQAVVPQKGCDVFFRADDIGYPGRQFSEMMAVFRKHQVPLALAVVPAWLNEARAAQLFDVMGDDQHLWCLHQHGYRHRNCEKTGKKYEFGSSRGQTEVCGELTRGKVRLAFLLGESFCPIFTPPWNRCSRETMNCLQDLGFKAISRSTNVSPCPPQTLPDIPVNVDLHTVKTIDTQSGINDLQHQFEDAIASGHAGIMLHHQRMNRTSLLFLDLLLGKLGSSRGIQFRDIRELLP